MEEPRTEVRSRAVLWVAVAGLGVILVAAAIAAVTRSPSEFDPGAPEAVAQSYLRLMLDGEERAAHALLSERLQAACTVTEMREVWLPESVRITWTETVLVGDTAEVELVVVEGGTDPFGGGGEYEITLVLTRSAEGWVINEPPWPIYCEREGL